jgi:hypothetical protein
MNNKISFTDSSIQSIPDLTSRRQTYLYYFYLIISFVNSIIGGYIIFGGSFKNIDNDSFKVFIIVFTFIWLSAIIIGSSIYIICILLIKAYNLILRKESTKNEGFGLLNGIYVSCISSLTFLYVIAIPLGIYYIIYLIGDTILCEIQRFYLLYLFTIANIIIGTLTILSFLYIMICLRTKVNNKENISLNDEFIKKIENEIKETSRVSGILQFKDTPTNPNTTVRNDINIQI